MDQNLWDVFGIIAPLGEDLDKIDEGLRSVSQKTGLTLLYELGSLEFEYSGKNSGSIVEKTLAEIAVLHPNWDGEISAQLQSDEGEYSFWFFTITNGDLVAQRGKVVREHPQKIQTEFE